MRHHQSPLRSSVFALLLVSVCSASTVASAGVTVFTDEATFIGAVGNHALEDFESAATGSYGTATQIGELTFSSPPSGLFVNSATHSHGAKNTTPSGARYLFADSTVPAFHDDLTMGVVTGDMVAWGAMFTDLEVGPITFFVDGAMVHTQGVLGTNGAAQFFGFVADAGTKFQAVTLKIPDITYGIDDVRTIAKVCEYGAGCPGSGGFVPNLTSSPCGAVDVNTQLVMTVSGGLGGASATFFLGIQEVALPIGGSGCTLNVSPLLVNFTVPLGGTGPGNGVLTLAGVIPPSAAGLGFKAQVFVIDPAGAEGFAASNGLAVDVN